MLNKRFLFVSIMFITMLWLGSPSAVFSTQPNLPDTSLGDGFTYQGYLKDASGNPIHDTCDLRFSLWDASSVGSQIGTDSTVTGAGVVYGYFSALVNAGGEFGSNSIDNTYARWLEVEVMCSGDVSYTLLGPRQAITWTPPTHDHLGQTWSGNNSTGLELSGSYTGLYANGIDVGVHGSSNLMGVYGETNGIYETCDGVVGVATSSTGSTHGVFGYSLSNSGYGVYGHASAMNGTTYGVYGKSNSTSGRGMQGIVDSAIGYTYGVWGESTSANGRGVRGHASATTGFNIGVYGTTNSTDGYAGYFTGPVYIAGPLTKPGGSFKIDHPLDPENQFLYHSFVESPEMKNVYDGVVTLDENGETWVALPDWFEALNKDFRYQLTPIGAAMPDLHVAQEIQNNSFSIAGGLPGARVSWLVTGVRHDPWAEANRIPVEQPKPADQQGFYLHPELYGQPAEQGIGYEPTPE